MYNNKNSKNERGVTLIETAISIPVVLSVLLGVVQYGFVFASQLSLRQAASVASRYAILGQPYNHRNANQAGWYRRGQKQREEEIANLAIEALPSFIQKGRLESPKVDTSYRLRTGLTATKVELTYHVPVFLPFIGRSIRLGGGDPSGGASNTWRGTHGAKKSKGEKRGQKTRSFPITIEMIMK